MAQFFIIIPLLILVMTLPSAGAVAAKVGGWAKLTQIYASQAPYEGEKVLCSGRMGIAHYGFSLLVGGNDSGISLEVSPWLRIGHRPLFIPWQDMAVEESKGFFYPRVLVRFQKCPGIILRMPKKDALKVRNLPGCGKAFPGIF